MSWRPAVPLLAVVLVLSCDGRGVDPDMSPDHGFLAVTVTRDNASDRAVPGRLVIDGPTYMERGIVSGRTDTITALLTGSYQLGLEYLDGVGVLEYGEASVAVAPGGLTRVSIDPIPFRPGVPTAAAGATMDEPTSVTTSPVVGADSYAWEYADDPTFSNATEASSPSPSLQITFERAGTHHVRVRAVNQFSGVGVWSDPGTVDVGGGTPPVEITSPGPLPQGTVGEPYEFEFEANGGTGQFSWSRTGGSLPVGLTLDAQGVVSGTPTEPDTATFTVQATSGGGSDSAQFQIIVAPATSTLSIATLSPLPTGTVGTPYSVSLRANGGVGGYEWDLSNGVLPTGLSLSRAGAIAGVPTTAGTFTFTARVTSGVQTDSRQFRLTVQNTTPALSITSTSPLIDGTVGQPYNVTLQATGGTGSYGWAVISGGLPTGLTLNTVGNISGTPSIAGTSTFTVQVTSGAQVDAKQLQITVQSGAGVGPTVTISSPAQGQFFTVGSTVTFTATSSAGSTCCGWDWAVYGQPQGTLGSGSTVTRSFFAGQFTAYAVAVDAQGRADTASVDFVVRDPGGNAGSSSIGAIGNRGTDFLWAEHHYSEPTDGWIEVWVEWGPTPALGNRYQFGGPVLNIGGYCIPACNAELTGLTPFTPYYLAAGGRNAWGQVLSTPPVVTATLGPYAIQTPPTLPSAQLGVSYSWQLVATGGDPLQGTGGFIWLLTGGSLPPGLTLSVGGLVSGTATATGTYSFTVQVEDPSLPLGPPAVRTFSLTVVP